MSEKNARPGWYLAPGGRRRWWDGLAWHDQRTADAPGWNDEPATTQATVAPAQAAPRVSGVAIGGMIVGIIGLLIGIDALTKPLLFLGYADIFGPLVLGGIAVVLAAVSGRAGGGFRVAAFVCGGLLFIIAIASN